MTNELSAYRFVGNKIVEMTSETEIQEVEDALSAVRPLRGAETHLQAALSLLADREAPDCNRGHDGVVGCVDH